MNCFVLFSCQTCVLQDLNIKKVICLGNQVEGLYRLHIDGSNLEVQAKEQNNTNSINVFFSIDNPLIPMSDTSHFRLNNVSRKRVTHMSQSYSFFFLDKKSTCDIYHLARKRRSPLNFVAVQYIISR